MLFCRACPVWIAFLAFFVHMLVISAPIVTDDDSPLKISGAGLRLGKTTLGGKLLLFKSSTFNGSQKLSSLGSYPPIFLCFPTAFKTSSVFGKKTVEPSSLHFSRALKIPNSPSKNL